MKNLVQGYIAYTVDHFYNEIEEFKDAFVNKNMTEAFLEMLDVMAFLSLDPNISDLLKKEDAQLIRLFNITYFACYKDRKSLYSKWRLDKIAKYPNGMNIRWLMILKNMAIHFSNNCVFLDSMIEFFNQSKSLEYAIECVYFINDYIMDLGDFVKEEHSDFLNIVKSNIDEKTYDKNVTNVTYLTNKFLTFQEFQKVIEVLLK